MTDLRRKSAAIDDRSPYGVAEASLHVIAEHSPLADEQAVLDKILEAIGPASYRYALAITQSRHSVFYNQLQALYEFGKRTVDPAARAGFCRLVGVRFGEMLLAESVLPLEQAAGATEGSYQQTVFEIIRLHATRHTGDKYALTAELDADEIRLSVRYRSKKAIVEYLCAYDLDPGPCFRNSIEVIAGSLEPFLGRMATDYDGGPLKIDVDDLSGTIHLPVSSAHRFDYETLIRGFSEQLRSARARQETAAEDGRLRGDLILGSELMREQFKRIRRASQSDELILLRGESGTGKSVMARRIHELSARRDGPFIEVDLTADAGSENLVQSNLFGHERGAFTGADRQKQGLFSLANGGTIFLDEIGDASADVQAKLLRVLEASRFRRLGGVEDVQVDVRVIAATNRNLEELVSEGHFRGDLYYRLNVISILLPPLREHPEDIPALASFLLARAQQHTDRPRVELPEELAHDLATLEWPGNIRELDHALRHAVALAAQGEIRRADLPTGLFDSSSAAKTLRPAAPPRARPGPSFPAGAIVDEAALREQIRSTNPVTLDASTSQTAPAHIDYAKRLWLSALIEELGGDLALIGKFWDRGSEKTLRKLIQSYSLGEQLERAREARAKR